MKIIVGNGTLITQNNKNEVINNGAVVIDGKVIIDCGLTKDMISKYAEHDFIDAKNKLIMPGLINNHMHIYSAFARGMFLKDSPTSHNFLEILNNLWWRIDKKISLEDVKYSAYTTYIDSIKNGVTSVVDHHASQGAVRDSLFTISDVAKELGIRTSLCYEVSDRDGEKVLQDSIDENVAFIKHANKIDDDMTKAMFGLHASFTVSDKTLEKCATAIEGLNAGYHVHTAEAIDDVYSSLKTNGKRVVERFFDFNILGKKSLAVHCVHINNNEMNILKNTNTPVINNPESNMGNAVGTSPILQMINKGVNVGIGTDGYTSDMLESMKVFNIIQKDRNCDPSVAWAEPVDMLFKNNREIFGRQIKGDVGVIENGALADIIVVDYNPLTPLTGDNFGSHAIFGFLGRSVETSIINGKIVMKNRVIQGIDEESIFEKSRELSQKLWDRM